MSLNEIKYDIKQVASPARAKSSQRYFKTGKGEYAQGDVFIGITVPECRQISLKYKELPLKELQHLLSSKIHEERLIALQMLITRHVSAF